MYNKGDSPKLKQAFDIFGKEDFNLNILLRCPVELLDYYEYLFINLYDSTNPNIGYNILSDKLGNYMLFPEIRTKLSESMKNKWLDITYREKQEHIRKNPVFKQKLVESYTEEVRRQMSNSIKNKWLEPSYRKKLMDIRTTTEYKKNVVIVIKQIPIRLESH